MGSWVCFETDHMATLFGSVPGLLVLVILARQGALPSFQHSPVAWGRMTLAKQSFFSPGLWASFIPREEPRVTHRQGPEE